MKFNIRNTSKQKNRCIKKNLASDSINSYKYATLFVCIFFSSACETKLKEMYVKARTSEELKINAFESCGSQYKVLSYEDDTARIRCLKQSKKN